jgi:hypothetical protein
MCVAALLALVPAVRSTVYYAIGSRVGSMLQGSVDSATRARLAYNWSIAATIAEKNWVLGAGLGNFDVAVEEVRPELARPELVPRGTQGWNVLAYVLATTGIVGVSLLLLPLVAIARGHPYLGALQFASLFAYSGVLTPLFWLLFALFAAASMARAAELVRATQPASALAISGKRL